MTAVAPVVAIDGLTGFDVHPAANVFPLMTGADFDALCADVKANGLREPIVRVWVDDGYGNGTRKPLVLDGRNRLRACIKTGTPYGWRDYDGDDPIAFVLSANLHRRHLNESQRAMVATKIATLPHGGDRGNQHSGGKRPFGRLAEPAMTQAAAAKALNVGERTVRRARQVMESATPEVVARVEQGEISVYEAARIVASAQQANAIEPTPEPPSEAEPEPENEARPNRRGANLIGRTSPYEKEILALLDEGLGTGEIAERLNISPSTVHGAKRRNGLNKKDESPLAKLVSYAQEFSDAWEMVLANPSAIDRATAAQRLELIGHLGEVVSSTKRLIKRLQQK